MENNNKEENELNIGYVLEGEPKTNKEIETLFKTFDLGSKFHLFESLIRPKIDVELVESDEAKIPIGNSKMGGKPDLATGINWPTNNANKSLSFIGQINCDEIRNYDASKLLPEKGLISFFYCANQEAWGFDPEDKDRFKVIFTTLDTDLVRHDFPSDLEEHSIFRANEIEFDNSLSLPGWEHYSIDGLLSDDELDEYMEISGDIEHQILGYADCVQGAMELECQLVTNGLFCGDSTGYNDPKRKELESGKEDWILLFQIDSDEDSTGMMWGDDGKLYFWIRKQDLMDKNFDNCWCVLQCY
ncbi:YwqG family protein [Brumimicrobium mesophilum]|uniref:YwqG family protein n=1 Tax=Brumimicrobium mesophilum TaxID=392717 RepID=UPI000D13F5B8|nr:YwqG family protein [Brumimicrobium mesophilum]